MNYQEIIFYNLSNHSISTILSIKEVIFESEESIRLFKTIFGVVFAMGSRARYPRNDEPLRPVQ